MKIIKKFTALLIAACLITGMMPQSAAASSTRLSFHASTSGSGNEIPVKSVKYDGEVTDGHYDFEENGSVYELEVDFLTYVTWKQSAKVSVKDHKGKTYRSYLSERDDDGCDILIANLKVGRTYTIVINGIKKYGTSAYRKLTLKVKIPTQGSSSQKVMVAKVSVSDDNDSEIDVKFASKVLWKRNAKVVSVKDNKGRSYKGYLTDKDDDDCEIYIHNMRYGRTYKIKISGIKAIGASAYKTITITAKIPSQHKSLSVKKVEYEEDFDDGRMEYTVTFDFNKKILHRADSYVLITDSAGIALSSSSSYVEWDDDECEIHLSSGLSRGSVYHYQIVHVKAVGSGYYTTLKGSFTAY